MDKCHLLKPSSDPSVALLALLKHWKGTSLECLTDLHPALFDYWKAVHAMRRPILKGAYRAISQFLVTRPRENPQLQSLQSARASSTLAVHPHEDHYYVQVHHKIQIFHKNGTFIRTFADLGSYSYPAGMTFNVEGTLFICDCGPDDVLILPPEGEMSCFGATDLSNPNGIAVDLQGRILVCDSSHNRIQIYTPRGKFIRTFGFYGSAPGALNQPMTVGVDSQGNIIVGESLGFRIQIFSPSYESIKIIPLRQYVHAPVTMSIANEGKIVLWNEGEINILSQEGKVQYRFFQQVPKRACMALDNHGDIVTLEDETSKLTIFGEPH